MAESKNNRKKKKKRTQNHRAPDLPPTKEKIAKAEEVQKKQSNMLKMSIVSFILMLAGFVVAQTWSHFIGYPIAFAGSIMGIYSAREQERGRTVTVICYGIFSVLVAFMWFAEVLAR